MSNRRENLIDEIRCFGNYLKEDVRGGRRAVSGRHSRLPALLIVPAAGHSQAGALSSPARHRGCCHPTGLSANRIKAIAALRAALENIDRRPGTAWRRRRSSGAPRVQAHGGIRPRSGRVNGAKIEAEPQWRPAISPALARRLSVAARMIGEIKQRCVAWKSQRPVEGKAEAGEIIVRKRPGFFTATAGDSA